MSDGWIDISECTEGYWLFNDDKDSYPVEVSKSKRVWSILSNVWVNLDSLSGKALKLCDINNNGEVCVMANGGV